MVFKKSIEREIRYVNFTFKEMNMSRIYNTGAELHGELSLKETELW